jgi:hypothetical protein
MACCKQIANDTKNISFKHQLSQIMEQNIGSSVLQTIGAAVKTSKSPFDVAPKEALTKEITSTKNMMTNLVHTIVEFNKGRGGENAEHKEALMSSVKVAFHLYIVFHFLPSFVF